MDKLLEGKRIKGCFGRIYKWNCRKSQNRDSTTGIGNTSKSVWYEGAGRRLPYTGWLVQKILASQYGFGQVNS